MKVYTTHLDLNSSGTSTLGLSLFRPYISGFSSCFVREGRDAYGRVFLQSYIKWPEECSWTLMIDRREEYRRTYTRSKAFLTDGRRSSAGVIAGTCTVSETISRHGGVLAVETLSVMRDYSTQRHNTSVPQPARTVNHPKGGHYVGSQIWSAETDHFTLSPVCFSFLFS